MDLSEDIINGLTLVSDLDFSGYCELLDISFEIILQKKDESLLDSQILAHIDKLTLKRCYASLVGFILEAGKINAEPILLRGILSEHSISGEKGDYFIDKYELENPNLITLLATTGFNFPHIVGVDWRLTYYLKSNSLEKENRPVYFIKLKTQTPGEVPINSKNNNNNDDNIDNKAGNVQFSCSVWELLDLQNKLKDALNQFDRIANE
eukprot:TRINITY_DN182_c0_g1_i1.p1 TRINITY_DN182_c0_g1~~TRINITY_DN182_c0_g1_i1.p1  ORF type:complete len:208 (-),score=64.74 TRINITY_DN182_c0_g1_i1:140-763(-)